MTDRMNIFLLNPCQVSVWLRMFLQLSITFWRFSRPKYSQIFVQAQGHLSFCRIASVALGLIFIEAIRGPMWPWVAKGSGATKIDQDLSAFCQLLQLYTIVVFTCFYLAGWNVLHDDSVDFVLNVWWIIWIWMFLMHSDSWSFGPDIHQQLWSTAIARLVCMMNIS